jgi:phage tail-like protein
MANGFVVNATRFDPYKNFKFTLEWDGKEVLGISKVSSIKRTTEVVKHRSGGENSYSHKSPGRTEYDGITLERGITHDPAFAAWAALVSNPEGDPLMDLNGFRKNVTLNFKNEKGQTAYRYFLFDAWVSEYTALPDLDANANVVAIENMKLEFEYFTVENSEPDQSA